MTWIFLIFMMVTIIREWQLQNDIDKLSDRVFELEL